MFLNWCRMACVVGYLRHYYRWNGKPGLTLEEQRRLICEIARERKYGRGVGRLFLEEGVDGEETRWPKLRKAIRMADDNADRDLLVVIPTLDGVQFNLSFLQVLSGGGDAPIYVRSGWRRPKIVEAKNTNYERRFDSLGWLLSLGDEAEAFAEMVSRVRQRALVLGSFIGAGLKEATRRGVRLGSRRRGSHRFTKAEQSKGGQVTAKKRRLLANDSYTEWLPDIYRWQANGDSIGAIVMRLAENGALTKAGRKIGPMQVYRILKRRNNLGGQAIDGCVRH
jgi:hypothetical protein